MATERAPQCWSCLTFLQVGGPGISLDGGTTPHICKGCWGKLPVYRRIQLQLMARPAEEGGLGLRALVERFLYAVDAAEDGKGPGIWPGRN